MVSTKFILFDILLFLVLVASCTLCTLLAVAVSIARFRMTGLAISAAAVNIFGVIWTSVVLIIHAVRRSGVRRYIIFLSLVVSFIAAALTLIFLFWTNFELMDEHTPTFLSNPFTILNIEYGIWGGAVILQFLFFVTLLQDTANDSEYRDRNVPETIQVLPQIRAQSPLLGSRFFTTQYQFDNGMPSPTTSSPSLSGTHTSTHSPPQPPTTHVYPFSSQTWLGREPLLAQNSVMEPQTPSTPATAEESSTMLHLPPSAEMSQLADQPATPVRTRLETIPGSTSNSPGRLLDNTLPVQPPYLRNASARSISTHSRASSESFHTTRSEFRVAPRFRRNSNPYTAAASQSSVSFEQTRTSSVPGDESHVHPLFRTTSPNPPTASVSTMITASAYGGQALSIAEFSQASSRPGSPAESGRMRAESLTRLGLRSRSGSYTVGTPNALRSKSVETIGRRNDSAMGSDNDVPPIPNSPNGTGESPSSRKPKASMDWPLPSS